MCMIYAQKRQQCFFKIFCTTLTLLSSRDAKLTATANIANSALAPKKDFDFKMKQWSNIRLYSHLVHISFFCCLTILFDLITGRKINLFLYNLFCSLTVREVKFLWAEPVVSISYTYFFFISCHRCLGFHCFFFAQSY